MKKKFIIQITDMHLFEHTTEILLGVNTWDSFNAVVDAVQKDYPSPDLMLLTGDLAQDETVIAYQKLTRVLSRFHCPKYGIPGNHDDEKHMHAVFKENHFQENKSIIVDNWHFILLNTQKLHAVEGLLSPEQLHFLDQALGGYPEHSTMIFMHHPPVPVGSEWIDKLMLSNADQFWDLLENYHHVRAIFCGHVHQEFSGEKNGISIFTTPSTCFQFASKSQKFGVEPLMPGYRVIEIDENGHFETKVIRVAGFDLNLDITSGGY